MEHGIYKDYVLQQRGRVPVMLYHEGEDYVAGTTWRGAEADERDTYSGFSVCTYVGDDVEHTLRCREALRSAFGARAVVLPRQTHTATVAVLEGDGADADDAGVCVGDGVRIVTREADLQDVDAVVTPRRGVLIGVNTADCVPVLLADARAGVVAAVHAGWRGAVAGIVPAAVAAMAALGVEPSRTVAHIGPCIHDCCFEVGEEVAARFPGAFVRRLAGAPRPYVDLAGFVAGQLHDAGVTAVTASALCTRCNSAVLFSARSHTIRSGRLCSFIGMPEA